MPMDLEMLLSASRSPLFSYSPFGDERFSLTSGYDDSDYNSSLPLSRDHILVGGGKSRRFGFIQERPAFTSYKAGTDLKPTNKKSSNAQELPRKKKVSFADDKGLDLVEVREIPGAPKWTDEVLTLLIGGSQKIAANEKTWKLGCDHPPWEDSKLVELLDRNKVCLESVSIKKSPSSLHGTVKVKNLAYEKNVFVRISYDRWVSYVDIKAAYVKPKGWNFAKPYQYDTFCFNTQIAPSAMRYGVIEFCVGFQCNGREYWDNNGGINYRLIADSTKQNSDYINNSEKASDDKITLSLTENIENFSEIDAWSNFMMYNQPYW